MRKSDDVLIIISKVHRDKELYPFQVCSFMNGESVAGCSFQHDTVLSETWCSTNWISICNYKSLSPGRWFICMNNEVSCQISTLQWSISEPSCKKHLECHLWPCHFGTSLCLPAFQSRASLLILTVHLNYCSSRASPNLSEDMLLFLCLLFLDCWCFSCQHTHSMNIFLFSKFWKGDRNLLLVSFIFFPSSVICDDK